MHALTLKFKRFNEPAEFNLQASDILDPVGPVEVGLREGATESGQPSVTLVIPVAGGKFAVLETTWRLWDVAHRGMAARIEAWGKDPR